jgi:4-hydroxysphinganine ceramide fatty acyl 2-hydroxylase
MLSSFPSTEQSFSKEEIQKHHSVKSLWVSQNDSVYDITHFMDDHPGGAELLLHHGGKDITDVLKNGDHSHSEAAYEMLQTFLIGKMKHTVGATNPKPVAKFIDVTKPMLAQIYSGNFSKAFYMKQIHISHHVKNSAPIFGHWALEMFTKTYWWFIPIFWGPFITYTYLKSIEVLSPPVVTLCFALGLFLWTFIEYSLHRFLFHMDDLMPDHYIALTIHL